MSARAIPSPPPTGRFAVNVRVALAAALATGRNKIVPAPFFYFLVWLTFPIFNLLIVGLIYQNNRELRDYAIVGGAGVALLFIMLFNASEILDNERQRGTLGNLFLTPCSRYAWLAGFQLFAITEALVSAMITLAIGALAFGIDLSINPLSLIVSLLLFFTCMWGFSMISGAIGIAIRNANRLSNLLFPTVILFAGTMYPIDLMPDWVRIPARFLPFGYGIEALSRSMTEAASIVDLWPELLPMLGFSIVLPFLGMAAFNRLEHLTRQRGHLELM